MTTTQNTTGNTLIGLLRELVTSETRLGIATREAHWNVKGPAFYSLHEMFGAQYTLIDGFIDDIAERVRQLGYYVSGSPLMGASEITSDADELLTELSIKHEKTVTLLRKAIQEAQNRQDEGTADLLTGIMEQHDKMRWMINASITDKEAALINIQH
jgi:starvation-inducible DNA-binding protein